MRYVLGGLQFAKKLNLLLGVLFICVIVGCTPAEDTTPTMVISDLSPSTGDIEGGYKITINGSNLTFVESVDIGDSECTDIAVSPTRIQCTVPAGDSSGPVQLTVRGKANRSVSTTFTYNIVNPTVSSFSPTMGAVFGGISMYITGAGFASGTNVSIGGVNCTLVNVISSSLLECATPAKPVGSYAVVVTNPGGGTVTATSLFAYNAVPTLTSVSPTGGSTAGGNTITLTGTGFLAGARVSVGSSYCTSVNVVSSTTITCVTAPNASGLVDIRVTNLDTQYANLLNSFTFYVPPTISTISPSAGALAGGTTVTITGTNFGSSTTVDIGTNACTSVNATSATSLTCVTQANVAGTYAVSVKNPGTATSTLTPGYTYQAAPTVTSISPTAGDVGGGTMVTITGTNFRSGATVKIGTVSCTGLTVLPTSITCLTGANTAGTYAVTVTNTDTQTGTLAAAYTYQPAPLISSITPNAGPLAGTSVTIAGTNFLAGATVDIGGVACAGPVITSTSITCTAGANTAGAKTVTVTNPDTQVATLTNGFTYLNPVTLTSVSPTGGALAGGTTITLTGTNFFAGATVTVGGSACTSVNVVSSTSLTCVTPAKAAGSYNVDVTNVDGMSASLAAAYTYQPAPTVSGIAPPSGVIAGGNAVTINGTDFLAGVTVTIGGVTCNVTASNATSITCTAGAHAAGTVDIVVTNTDLQTGTLVSGYTYNGPPTVASIAPNFGPDNGSTAVTITGTNFVAGATVDIGGVACSSVNVASATSIICSADPNAAGVKTITVTNPDAQTGTLANAYTYVSAPTVATVSPGNGSSAGGTSITLTGTNFTSGSTVDLGGSACTVTAYTPTSITCTTTAHANGAVTVTVQNPDGRTGTLAAGYTFDPSPSVASIAPVSGPSAGGTAVTISGGNFVAGATVSIGGVACTGVTLVNATTITCTTGAGTAGAQTITVTNVDAQSGSLAAGYTYVNAPTISSISPQSGPPAGGTAITITGTSFSGSSVTINGSACTGVTVVNPTTITCTTPAGSVGVATVVVTNGDGQTATNSSAFSYSYPPVVSYTTPSYGKIGGGDSVTIVGTGFVTGATVTFGANPATGCTVNSGNSITCTTPSSLVTGPVSVTVTNLDGQTNTLASGFIYLAPPVLTSVTPNQGALAGGTSVSLSGSSFFNGATVTVGGSACTSVNVASSTLITCVLPGPKPAGAVNVVVTNVDGQSSTLSSGYTYQAGPTVTSISPSNGSSGGGTSVTITGSGFMSGATVTIGAASCAGVTVVNPTTITCTTTAQANGTYAVTVTNTDTQTTTQSNLFTYRSNPSVTSISPASGTLNGGGTLTITGTGFFTGDTVKIGTTSCSNAIIVSATQITCTIPAQTAGTYDVVVSSPDMQGTLFNSYTYRGQPTVTSVSPSSGVQAGNTLITITGTGYYAGAAVLIGGDFCTSITVVNATTITCRTPARPSPGAVSVVVVNTDNQSGSLAGGYTYTAIPVLAFVVGATSPTPPNPDDFGSTTTNVTHTFTLKNTGEGTSSSITVSLSGSAAFTKGTDNCTGTTLAPNGTCTVQVTFLGGFMPTGSYTGTLNATATSGGTTTNAIQGSVP